MYKTLIKNTLIYGLAPQVSRILSILVLPFITPFLTPLDYGIFGVAIAVTSAISVFSTLGVSYVLMLYFYKSPNHYQWLWKQIQGFLKIWMLVFALLQTLCLYFFLPNEANANFILIAILFALPYLFFSGYSFIGNMYYKLSEKAMPIAARTVVVGVVLLTLNLLTIRHFKLGYLGWFIAMSASDFLANILYFFPMKYKYKLRPIYKFKIKTIKMVLKKSFPLIPHYYSIYLLDLSDRLVMKVLNIPVNQIGNYNVIANFGSYFSSFHMAVGQAIGPSSFKSIKENNHEDVNKVIKIYLFLTLCLTITFSIWCKEILHLLIRNDALLIFYSWSILIVMAYNYRPYYVLLNQYLSYNEKVKYLPYFTFIPGILNLALNFILMPIFGIKVAIYTTFCCYMLMGFLAFLFKKVRLSFVTNYSPLIVLTFIIVSTFLCYYIVDSAPIVKMLSNLAVLLVAFVMLNKFPKLKLKK